MTGCTSSASTIALRPLPAPGTGPSVPVRRRLAQQGAHVGCRCQRGHASDDVPMHSMKVAPDRDAGSFHLDRHQAVIGRYPVTNGTVPDDSFGASDPTTVDVWRAPSNAATGPGVGIRGRSTKLIRKGSIEQSIGPRVPAEQPLCGQLAVGTQETFDIPSTARRTARIRPNMVVSDDAVRCGNDVSQSDCHFTGVRDAAGDGAQNNVAQVRKAVRQIGTNRAALRCRPAPDWRSKPGVVCPSNGSARRR